MKSLLFSKYCVLSLVLSLAAAGCTEDLESNVSNQSEATIREGVHILDASMMAGVLVEAGSLHVAPEGQFWLADVRVGDIVVSGQGNGFLRRVTAIDSLPAETVLATEPAMLTEALESARIGESLHSNPISAFGFGQFADFGFDLDLGGTELYSRDGVSVTVAEGTVSFQPSLDVDLDIGLFSGVDFSMVASGAFDSRFVVRADAQTSVSESFQFQRTLYTSPTVRVPLMVGGFPLTLAITSYLEGQFEIAAGAQGNASAGAELHTEVSAGLAYDNGFSTFGDSDLTFKPVAPRYELSAELNARASLTPRIEVLILDSAGPTLGVEAYAQLAADAGLSSEAPAGASCELLLGLRGELGGKLSILGLIDLAELDYELFDRNTALDCFNL